MKNVNCGRRALGRLPISGSQTAARVRAKVRRLLHEGGANRFDVSRAISEISELSSKGASKDCPLEIAFYLEEDGPSILFDIAGGRVRDPDIPPSRGMNVEISADGCVKAHRRVRIAVRDPDSFAGDAIAIIEEPSEEELHRLLIDKEAAEAGARAQLQFMRRMSHELRTPLNVILGYSEMLIEDSRDAQVTEDLGNIHDAGRELLRIVDDVLSFSRSEMGELMLEVEPFSCRALVEELKEEMEPQLEKNGNGLILECSGMPAELETDRSKVMHIVSHLLRNAGEFTEDGQITLSVDAEARGGVDGVRFGVDDTGQGIKAEEMASLFTPFKQVDESTTRAHSGIGLGLALCQRYSTLLGGTLQADSRAGEWTTFELWIPRQARG